MFDQSFSAKNFSKIIDFEGRKGNHVADVLGFAEVRWYNQRIKDCNHQINYNSSIRNLDEVNRLHDIKLYLRTRRKKALDKKLDEVSQNIQEKTFRISLDKIVIPGGKPLYIHDEKPETYFAIKQVQRNLSTLFGIKQANRNSIVSQVLNLLNDSFPKYIIRTDIKEFYETIRHEPLNQRILRDNLVNPTSKKIIANLLNEYKLKSGSSKGVPRGIGVSAYLAELYMRDVDNDIKEIEGVSYYARYVDDIIIIYTPSPAQEPRDYLDELKTLVEQKHGVRLNPSKTKPIDLRNSPAPKSFDYLGYEIFFGNGNVETELTSNKVSKYKERVKLAFDHYVNLSVIDEKSARKILVKRIRFLTGNTRLKNNKKNILVGVFFSNQYLTRQNQFHGIDMYLKWQIDHRITSFHLKERLRKYKFQAGFENKRFSPFTTEELEQIMSVWKAL